MTATAAQVSVWDQLWLPQRPLATDSFIAGLHRERRPVAFKRRYVEANPRALSNLLVVDIDHEDAVMRALWERPQWLPNALVENPENGHAHAVWALNEPVTRTEYSRRKPLAFAAAVTEGLRRSVDGDTGYSGLITKNPIHEDWDTMWNTGKLYSLAELENHLTDARFMPPATWARTRRKRPVGLGRNCSLFESARTWAYREVRKHFGDSIGLFRAISAHVKHLNGDFSEPLPENEAQQIAKSIHHWITTQSRMWRDGSVVYEANFIAIQSARGRKGGRASGTARREKSARFWEGKTE